MAKLLGGFDHASMSGAFGAPDMQHISFGLVVKGDENNPPVEFDKDDGQPYVTVTLYPRRLDVRCRVSGTLAGNGEGEWFPFLENDEVIVAIPDGDERAGATIIGRLNNSYDAFPTDVAGQDPAKNNFAFRRIRTPYILETASTYLVRSAITKAFWSIDSSGSLTFSDGNSNVIHVGADFIGMASGDNKVLAQLDLHENQFVVEANGTKLVLDGAASFLTTSGTLTVSTAGSTPSHHVTTAESMLVFVEAVLTALAAATAGIVAPMTGTAFAALLTPPLAQAMIIAATQIAATKGTVAPYTTALSSAFAIPPTPATPGLGKAGFVV